MFRKQCSTWMVNSLRPRDAYMRQLINQHCFRQCIFAWPALSHYMHQCWDIVNLDSTKKLQWNLNQNPYTFVRQNAFENVVWKTTAILCQPQCVNQQGAYISKTCDLSWFYISNWMLSNCHIKKFATTAKLAKSVKTQIYYEKICNEDHLFAWEASSFVFAQSEQFLTLSVAEETGCISCSGYFNVNEYLNSQ